MVRTCCVIGCIVRSHDREGKKIANGLSFHCFPAWKQREGALVSELTKKRRLAWIAAVRRPDINFSNTPRYLKVCSRHFHSGKPAYEMDESNPDWVPTLHLDHSEVRVTKSKPHARRLQRLHRRAQVGDVLNKSEALTHDGATVHEGEAPAEDKGQEGKDQAEMDIAENYQLDQHKMEAVEDDQVCQVVVEATDEDGDQAEREVEHEPPAKRQIVECQFCEQSREETNRLLQENRELRSELNKRKLDEEFLKEDTEKVQYYTGLPCFAILFSLFNSVKPFLPVAKKLSPFQMVLLTLMRLRLHLPVQHLCHLFNVSHKTLSAAFADTIDVLHARLKPLVHWPERHCLQATMPHQFLETFGKRIAIIVHCFEIHTEKPSNLKAHAQSFSHYKGTHNIKYLIGITPQGSILFISKGWGGLASDKHITENCGLLNKLLPRDVVLADRGFDIRDSVGMMCAEVKIPSFTKGRCQLDAKDVEDTQAIAHLRIYVERVVGRMRNNYKMLHKTIPISFLVQCEGEEMTLLDKIVNVCCILVNMCPSVVVKPEDSETCTC